MKEDTCYMCEPNAKTTYLCEFHEKHPSGTYAFCICTPKCEDCITCLISKTDDHKNLCLGYEKFGEQWKVQVAFTYCPICGKKL